MHSAASFLTIFIAYLDCYFVFMIVAVKIQILKINKLCQFIMFIWASSPYWRIDCLKLSQLHTCTIVLKSHLALLIITMFQPDER